MRAFAAITIFALISFPIICSAQNLANSLRTERMLDQGAANDAPLDTITVTGKTRIELSAGTEGQEATISYGDLAQQRWRLLFAAPLDKESGEAQFANLDGLANSTRITWEGRHYSVAAAPRSEADILKPNCAELRRLIESVNPKADTPLAEFGKKVNKQGDKLCLGNWFFDLKELKDPQIAGIADQLNALRKDVLSRLADETWINVTAFKVTGGIRSYEFIDIGPATAAKESIEEEVYSAELTSAWYHPRKVLISVGARWENTTKAKSSGTVCPASTAGEPVVCLTGSIGAPENVENTVGFIEAKWALKGAGLGVAMSPRVSYEVEKGVFGIDLPIYFLSSKADKQDNRDFVGGLRLGWRDDKDEVVAGVFVGKKFSLSPD